MKKITQLLTFSLLMLIGSAPFVIAHGDQSSCSSSCDSDNSSSCNSVSSYDQNDITICSAIIATDIQELKSLIIPGQELAAIKLLFPNMNFDDHAFEGLTFIHLLVNELETEILTTLASHFRQPEMQEYQAKLIALIKHAVSVGIDINAQDNYKETALMSAIEYCNIEVVQLLIDLGANLEIQDEYGDTALYYALEYGKYDATFLLIKSGANVNRQDADGYTPLMMVFFDMNEQYAQNHYLQEENPAIKFAVQPHAEIVRALLQAGADSSVMYHDDEYDQDISVMIIINAGLEHCKLELNSWTPNRAAKKLKRDLEIIKQIIEEFNSL